MSEIHEAVQDLPDEHRLALEERLREVLAKHGESG
jgi:hypothetical protein